MMALCSLLDRFEWFVADNPILFLVLLVLRRELYNLSWKHYSDNVSWRFPKTGDWSEFLGKLFVTLGLGTVLGLCAFLIVIPLFRMIGNCRSFLLDTLGHSDMAYHDVKIK